MCYFTEKLIVLNALIEVVPTGTHFTAESTEAMQIKSSVNYSKKAIKNHYGEVPVAMQTDMKHEQPPKFFLTVFPLFTIQTANNSKKQQQQN